MAGSPERDRQRDAAPAAPAAHASITRALPGRLPQSIGHMLPVGAPEPFDSTLHMFEVLWDGVRSLLFVERGEVRLQDRYGCDVTARYPELQPAAYHLNGSGVVLDGVIVCPDDEGRPDFARLHRRLSAEDDAGAALLAMEFPVTFQAFDLLYLNGLPVMAEPLRRRKALLQQAVRLQDIVTVPETVEREGVAFFEAARTHGLPGIIAKQTDSKYVAGARSSSWLAMRVYQRDKFVIAGSTYGRPLRPGRPMRPGGPFESLLLGQYDGGGSLRFAGEVKGPFDRNTARVLSQAMDTLAARESPFADAHSPGRLVFWSRPELVASVRFADRSPGGGLRFPIFECLRPDVPPSACQLP